MKRDVLNTLNARMRSFRGFFKKTKYVLERAKDLVRVAFWVPVYGRLYGVTDFMPPNDLIRWFEGVFYGATQKDV